MLSSICYSLVLTVLEIVANFNFEVKGMYLKIKQLKSEISLICVPPAGLRFILFIKSRVAQKREREKGRDAT